MRRAYPAIVAAAWLLLSACGRSQGGMVPVPPPRSWPQELAAQRKERDAEFASDPESPIPERRRASFRGLTYYPADPAWRYAGWITRLPHPERISMITTGGKSRPCERFGRLTFERDGRSLSLSVYRLLDMPEQKGGKGLFLPFKDATTGKETYEAGRYVELVGPDDGPFVLDFNLAYNPSCAYGEPERFQCPVTPTENTLPIRVTAGERGSAEGADRAER